MNKFHLEMFTVVVETRRITAAAKLLNLTQPAVSQQVKQLESYFGVPLLTRSPEGAVPTPAGQILYRHAREILAQYDRLEREIDDLTKEEDLEIVIGATPTVGNFALPCSLWTFKERFPKASLRVEIGTCTEMADQVLDRSVHLAVIEGPIPERIQGTTALNARCIAGDYVVLVTMADLEREWGPLTTETLRTAPLILPARNMGMRRIFEQMLEARGLTTKDLNIRAEMAGLEGMKTALENQGGVMLCTRMAVQRELRRDIYREVTPEGVEMAIPFHLICFEESLPPVARRFIRFIAAPEEVASCWT